LNIQCLDYSNSQLTNYSAPGPPLRARDRHLRARATDNATDNASSTMLA
jgi:hypothetical protein